MPPPLGGATLHRPAARGPRTIRRAARPHSTARTAARPVTPARPPHAPAAPATAVAHDLASAASPLDDGYDEIAASAAACGLTLRQAAVARLVARGLTNLQIAAALGISRYTARNHVAEVLARLAVARRGRVRAAMTERLRAAGGGS